MGYNSIGFLFFILTKSKKTWKYKLHFIFSQFQGNAMASDLPKSNLFLFFQAYKPQSWQTRGKKHSILDKAELDRGTGGIVCMCEEPIPIDEKTALSQATWSNSKWGVIRNFREKPLIFCLSCRNFFTFAEIIDTVFYRTITQKALCIKD